MPKESKAPDLRIRDAGTSLFARKGFAGVGVREIAKEANVNVSMISYYFGGKLGILKAMATDFFDRYSQIITGTDDESIPAEECVRALIRNLVKFVRDNEDLTMVMLTDRAMDSPDMAALRIERVQGLLGTIQHVVSRFGLDPRDTAKLSMIGPSLIGMIVTNLRLRRTIESVFKATVDDTYYDQYVQTIGTLFLRGIEGIAAEQQGGRE
jgi:AcrR family transcriptional regulator